MERCLFVISLIIYSSQNIFTWQYPYFLNVSIAFILVWFIQIKDILHIFWPCSIIPLLVHNFSKLGVLVSKTLYKNGVLEICSLCSVAQGRVVTSRLSIGRHGIQTSNSGRASRGSIPLLTGATTEHLHFFLFIVCRPIYRERLL